MILAITYSSKVFGRIALIATRLPLDQIGLLDLGLANAIEGEANGGVKDPGGGGVFEAFWVSAVANDLAFARVIGVFVLPGVGDIIAALVKR